MNCVRPAHWTWLLAGILWLTTGVNADQNDERLDPLFDELQTSPGVNVSSVIEQQIWVLWSRGPTEEASRQLRRGVRAMQQGELETALSLLDTLIEDEPEFAEAWNKRATLHFIRGDINQSLADIEQTLTLEPRHFGALAGLGSIFARLRQPEAAIRAYEQVLNIYPQSTNSQRNLERLQEEVEGRIL
ncbi:tetratricopeptide repeat protein [Saccharospirillum impatiens]|uniref:tetratricopeptide repeat protein n=1 Tax=Saccharospirillum impatiens TaxID=169438 RepID=UPI00041C8196|nr:tetratricopeptide repeat protein [Saccharospirillum impatiens]